MHPTRLALLEAEWLPTSVKRLPLILALSGARSALVIYTQAPTIPFATTVNPIGRSLATFFAKK